MCSARSASSSRRRNLSPVFSAHRRTTLPYVLYVVELGEEPCAKRLAPGSACGASRSRVSCGLLWCCSGYYPSLCCVDSIRVGRFVLRSPPVLVGCFGRYSCRGGKPLASAPSARC